MKNFAELGDNVYQYKTLGLSRQAEEGFTCDCVYESGSWWQPVLGANRVGTGETDAKFLC